MENISPDLKHDGIDFRSLARKITIVENELRGHESLLEGLCFEKNIAVTGFTGPPGAGKSTLINALLNYLGKQNSRVAILAIDPSSPFNYGALLGDRIRLAAQFNNPNIFIRSIASRGSLGGLSRKIVEITDLLRAEAFDYIFVETVGVGQSEVEIAGLADTTIVTLAPESGDEIQTMKAGVMEIADIFVVNKSDRPGADVFLKNLRALLHSRQASAWNVPVVKTIATSQEGIPALLNCMLQHRKTIHSNEKKAQLLAAKAFRIISDYRMSDISTTELTETISRAMNTENFNLYKFVKTHYS